MSYKVDTNLTQIKVATDATSYTLTPADEVYVAYEGQTVTLPSLANSLGRRYFVKLGSAATTGFTLAAGGGDNIEGSSSVSVTTDFGSVEVIGGSSAWLIGQKSSKLEGTGSEVSVSDTGGTATIGLPDSVSVTSSLTVAGLTYPTTDGTTGQVISTNGSGTLGWSSAGGGGSTTETLFKIADGNTTSDGTLDFGFYVERNASSWAGFVWDESQDRFIPFVTTTEPTTTLTGTTANMGVNILYATTVSATNVSSSSILSTNDIQADSNIVAIADVAAWGALLERSYPTTYNNGSTSSGTPTALNANDVLKYYLTLDANNADRYYQFPTASTLYTVMNSSKPTSSVEFKTTNLMRAVDTVGVSSVTVQNNTGVTFYESGSSLPVTEFAMFPGTVRVMHIISTSSTTADVILI
jgi:hypothetical protein